MVRFHSTLQAYLRFLHPLFSVRIFLTPLVYVLIKIEYNCLSTLKRFSFYKSTHPISRSIRVSISFRMMSAKSRRTSADPLVIIEKNFLFGERPIIAKIVLNENIHKKIPDKNINTIINLEKKSGRLKSLNRIIVPADVHHKYDQGEVTTIESPVKYLLKNRESDIVSLEEEVILSPTTGDRLSFVGLSKVERPR